jgi:phosphoglycerate dehydrogenase-like enzyme
LSGGRPKGLFILDGGSFDRIYGDETATEIGALVDLVAPLQNRFVARDAPELLAEVELVFSGWGGPQIDTAFLAAAPNVKAYFYGAGATGGMVSAEAYARGVVVTSAAAANAIPVAEYTLGAILLGLKQVFRLQRELHQTGVYRRTGPADALAGGYGTTVGLISLGAIGRIVAKRLSAALPDVRVVAHDPFVGDNEMQSLGLTRVDLDELFATSDFVSLHTPWLPETERMIGGAHFAAMKPGATFLNTARGAVVAEDEMIAVLQNRPDLIALLDVTYPEPPPPGSPLYTLPNVFLTPHIAGSVGAECRRLGRYMVEELQRYLAGQPLLYQIHAESAAHTSHRV